MSQDTFEKDVFETSSGKLMIYFIGHGTLRFDYNGKIIDVDPLSKLVDYSKFSKSDLILVTHHHSDHLDESAIDIITKKKTELVVTPTVYETLKKGVVLKNGDRMEVDGIIIEAVPAYNTTPGREKFHPKGRDNGYILTLGEKRIYIAGDTEDISEMASLINIDIAFLPMDQPYTMLPEQVVNAAGRFKPKLLYPYHYVETDVSKLQNLMPKSSKIEIRIRQMK